VSEDLDRAGGQPRQADDRIDRRRLAGAVRPEKTEEIARFDAQRNTIDRGEVSVPLDDVREVDGGRAPVRA